MFGWGAAAKLAAVEVVAAAVVQAVVGPTVVGAAIAVLVAVYGWAWVQPPYRRDDVKAVTVRTAALVGALGGVGYGGVGFSGVIALPTAGAALVAASAVVGALVAVGCGILTLCGLDAAATGRGGYSDVAVPADE